MPTPRKTEARLSDAELAERCRARWRAASRRYARKNRKRLAAKSLQRKKALQKTDPAAYLALRKRDNDSEAAYLARWRRRHFALGVPRQVVQLLLERRILIAELRSAPSASAQNEE